MNHKDLRDSNGEFLFIGGDSLGSKDPGPIFDGSLAVTFPRINDDVYLRYLNSRTPLTSAGRNPWFMEAWQLTKGCSYVPINNSILNCGDIEDEPFNGRDSHAFLASTKDAIDTFVYALDRLIKEQCPELLATPTLVKECINGEELLQYIRESYFPGTNWNVAFDESGDVLGNYVFRQYFSNRTPLHELVAVWENQNNDITVYSNKLDLSNFLVNEADARIHKNSMDVPDSVCSYPCEARQYQQQRELVCCWDCMSCRNNEIINADRDGCEKCPELMWPDEETATYCVEIEP